MNLRTIVLGIKSIFCEHIWNLDEVEFLPFTDVNGRQIIKYTCINCNTKYYKNL